VIRCACCGAKLTTQERRYYGDTCDDCEREWCERMEAWRHGAQDPELDRAFDEPRGKETWH
jgi:hypothetical protein